MKTLNNQKQKENAHSPKDRGVRVFYSRKSTKNAIENDKIARKTMQNIIVNAQILCYNDNCGSLLSELYFSLRHIIDL